MNKEQLEAVSHFDAPLLVLAGAGSGKTRVITEKVVHIIQNQMAMPNEILAVTFTNKAAGEMLDRIQKKIQIQGQFLNIGTFHRMALKILRRYANLLGYTNNFTILDISDQKKAITNLLKQMNFVQDVKPQTIMGFVSNIKENFIKPSQLENKLNNLPPSYAKIDIVNIYSEYCKELKRLDAMDFDDLIFNCVDLLESNPEIRTSYQNLFKYILIDEYQDINSLQARWVKLIAGNNKNITCVGDDDQSIYGWRGSNVSYILDFKKTNTNAKVVKLEQNYRSTKDILNVASKLIQHNEGRHGKTLWTDNPETHKVQIFLYYDAKAEAKYITGKVQDYKYKFTYKDFAILVRTIRQTRSIEEAMVFAGIPYKIVGGLRFYERMEIKDILAYIKIIVSSEDDIATERALATPKKGLGETTLSNLYQHARQNQTNLMTIITKLTTGFGEDIKLAGKVYNTLTHFGSQVSKWRKMLENNSLIEVMKSVLSEIQYEEYLKKDDEESFDARIENINELFVTMEGFATAAEFLDYVSLATSADDSDANQDAVNIMTMHASKGLEFPFVFLPGWNSGLFPSERSIEESGQAGMEEERRLAYVAITRAMEYLYISSTKLSASRQGFSLSSEPSFFLDEIQETAPASVEVSDESHQGQQFQSRGNSQYYTQSKTEKMEHNNTFTPYSSQETFYIGNLVSHKKFGNGTISKIAGSLVTVKFSDGTEKTIRDDFLTKKYI